MSGHESGMWVWVGVRGGWDGEGTGTGTSRKLGNIFFLTLNVVVMNFVDVKLSGYLRCQCSVRERKKVISLQRSCPVFISSLTCATFLSSRENKNKKTIIIINRSTVFEKRTLTLATPLSFRVEKLKNI